MDVKEINTKEKPHVHTHIYIRVCTHITQTHAHTNRHHEDSKSSLYTKITDAECFKFPKLL